MNIEAWSTMNKKARETWHRAEIETACRGAKSRNEVRRRMMGKSFGTDLVPYYNTTMGYVTLPEKPV